MFKFLLLICFWLLSAVSQEDFAKIQYKTTLLKPSFYFLEGAGGNITAFIGSEGTLLVDDDFAEMSDKLLKQIYLLKGAIPRLIINTHFHYDHTGGNIQFQFATIIAANEVRQRLSQEQYLWHKKHPAVLNGLPNVTFDQELNLYFNEEEIKIMHLKNGHTDGDTVVFFNTSKIVSMGDLYFSGMFPIFHPEHIGSLKHYLENINFVLKLIPHDSIIVPGHGPLSNKHELLKYSEMISDSIRTVRNGIKKNLSLEKIIKNGLHPKWSNYAQGYRNTEQWIRSIFEACKKGDC